MDVVYILGTGSLANDNEIRYSLRSLQEHMADLGTVYVIGESVPFLPGVVHIPAKDIYPKKWQNAMHKTLIACGLADLSDEFLLMNDDFFINEPFVGADFPFYSVKGADGGPNGRLSFQLHCPIRFNKDWYNKMPLTPDSGGEYSPRSFYCNFYAAPPTPYNDCIVRHGFGLAPFYEQIKGRPWFSISNGTMCDPEFYSWLSYKYPIPSRYEI